jgi:hypothetical protein
MRYYKKQGVTMTQQQIFDRILESKPYVFRNNRGRAKAVGKDGKPRFIRFGIPEPQGVKETDESKKGGDYIGWTMTEITPDMVGKTVAIFTSVEAKTKHDVLKRGQVDWHNLVIDCGGISEIWHDDHGSIAVTNSKIEV